MDRRVKVAYDLGLLQSMYRLPKGTKEILEAEYPVKLNLVNTPKAQKISEDAEIYWGNRIEESMLLKMPKLKWIHFDSGISFDLE